MLPRVWDRGRWWKEGLRESGDGDDDDGDRNGGRSCEGKAKDCLVL